MSRLPAEALRGTIREVVRTHLRQPVELRDDTPLLSSGLIDSMSLVDLVLALEQALGLAMALHADDFENLLTIEQALRRGS